MKKLNVLEWIVIILVIIGGLNWGLVGFFDFNLVTAIFGVGTIAKLVYDIVGIAALYMVYLTTSIGKK